jgi:hypothetical protein
MSGCVLSNGLDALVLGWIDILPCCGTAAISADMKSKPGNNRRRKVQVAVSHAQVCKHTHLQCHDASAGGGMKKTRRKE